VSSTERSNPSSKPYEAAGLELGGRTSLIDLALLFLRLGATAFGGPAAHIALMRDEVVRRRSWLSEQQFLDLVGATNLIPGPNSTEMAIHIGWSRRRWQGLVIAGVSFILPAMLITGGLAWAYVRYGKLPETGWLLWGAKPVIVAIIAQAVWRLTGTAARTSMLRVLGVGAVTAAAIRVNEITILFASGFLVAALRRWTGQRESHLRQLLPGVPAAIGTATLSSVTLPGLFWIFLKIGSVLFGSGYVLLAFLRADLVLRLHWLTEGQLLDAIVAGQVTPGPVFTTATFIGYVLAGPSGAVVATCGIFLPAFVFVAISGPLVARMRASSMMGAFLDGVNVASLALMAVVTAQLAHAAVVDLPTALLCALAVILLLRSKVNSAWLILGGAVTGVVIHLLNHR
jgi:chromate transporter